MVLKSCFWLCFYEKPGENSAVRMALTTPLKEEKFRMNVNSR